MKRVWASVLAVAVLLSLIQIGSIALPDRESRYAGESGDQEQGYVEGAETTTPIPTTIPTMTLPSTTSSQATTPTTITMPTTTSTTTTTPTTTTMPITSTTTTTAPTSTTSISTTSTTTMSTTTTPSTTTSTTTTPSTTTPTTTTHTTTTLTTTTEDYVDDNNGDSRTNEVPATTSVPTTTTASKEQSTNNQEEKVRVNGTETQIQMSKEGVITVTKDDLKESESNQTLLSLPLENGAKKHVVLQGKNGANDTNIISIYVDGTLHILAAGEGTYVLKDAELSLQGVSERHWAAGAIRTMGANQIMVGNESGDFMPGMTATRAMMTQIFAKLQHVGLQNSENLNGETIGFEDVEADKWYAPSIKWAADSGIISGVVNGKFAPETNITREELAVMLRNFLRFSKWNLAKQSESTTFTDGDSVSDWVKDAVAELKSYGVFVGKPGDLFDPKAEVTRAEIAAVVVRMLELYVKSLVK